MRHRGRTVEQEVARIADRQHGVVTRSQLLSAGVTPTEVRRRLRSGALLQEHRGVYRVGHRAPSIHARYLAAVLACGDGALLSGLAAGHLLGLVKALAPAPEVTTPTERRIPGLITRRSRSLDARDATSWHGIPVTTVPRTLVDLAAVLNAEDLARACHEAGVLHHTTPAQVDPVLARRPNTPGATTLRAVLRGETQVTLSKLERRFLSLIDEVGLPRPIMNRPAGTKRVDARWPDHNLTVELDSYRYHHSRHAWERDRRREREAHARGDSIRRYTHDDVFGDPGPMLVELRTLFGERVNGKA